MALSRLTAVVHVSLSFNASNPSGISRFLATCIAAIHCPRVLNPEHAVLRLPPGTEIPLFVKALASEVSSFPLLSTVIGDCEPMLDGRTHSSVRMPAAPHQAPGRQAEMKTISDGNRCRILAIS